MARKSTLGRRVACLLDSAHRAVRYMVDGEVSVASLRWRSVRLSAPSRHRRVPLEPVRLRAYQIGHARTAILTGCRKPLRSSIRAAPRKPWQSFERNLLRMTSIFLKE
jgi:hypothetical protein